MMPALPNLLLMVGAKSSDANETPKSSGKTEGENKSFASLMNLVSPPSGFLQPAKIEKPGHVESSKYHHKADDTSTGDDLLVGINPALVLDPNSVLVSRQNNFIPTPAPTVPVAGQKNELAIDSELASKITPDIFAVGLKTKIEKLGHAELSKHHHKADGTGTGTGGGPLVSIKPALILDPNAVLVSRQNNFIPTPASTVPVAGQKNALAAKTIPDIFSAGDKIKPAGQPAGVVPPIVAGSKIVPQSVIPENFKDAIPTVLGNVPKKTQDATKPMASSKIKADDMEPSSRLEKIFSDKTIIQSNAKTVPASPLPVQVAVLPAQMMVEPKTNSKVSGESSVKPAGSAAMDSTKEAVVVSKQPLELDSKQTSSQVPPLSSSNAEPEIESAVVPTSDEDGTSNAKDDPSMKMTDKLNKFAGAIEKNLPGNVAVTAREGGLPARVDQAVVNGSADSFASSRNADPSLSANVIAGSSGIDDRSQALDRTQEMVVQQALRLNGSSGDTLQVVIKPGAGTQLSLELRQHSGGGVEVQATLQHGDFNHLNQGWPELQQRLEQRGIRLAALTGDGSFAAGQGGNPFQQKNSQPADLFGEFVPAVSASGTFVPPATVAATHRGWETWA